MARTLALLGLCAAASATPLRVLLRERAMESERASAASRFGAPPPDLFFEQPLDHLALGAEDATTRWLQRFWVNDTFFVAKGRTGPVFLYVEGEGSGSPYSVLQGEHVELAAIHGALILSLEHRYYGASIPTPSLITSDLRFLSSHQAVGDVARFLTSYVAPTFTLDFSAHPVVTFGGSYPGALSAWLRLRLPQLISIAVSTSSPIEASYDFTGYNAVVGTSLAMPLIGGSDECVSAVRAAFTTMDEAFAAGGAVAVNAAKALNSCQTDLAKPNDAMWAASNYGGLIQGLVQYNDESGGLDVRGLCTIMLANATRTPFESFAIAVRAAAGPTCIDNSVRVAMQRGNCFSVTCAQLTPLPTAVR